MILTPKTERLLAAYTKAAIAASGLPSWIHKEGVLDKKSGKRIERLEQTELALRKHLQELEAKAK